MEEKNNIKRKKFFFQNWKNVITGDFLVGSFVKGQKKYILLLFILSLIYISNRHIFARTIRENAKFRKEAARSKAKYVTKSAELVRLRKRSNILKEIEKRNMGLVESTTPPIVLK